MKCARLKCQTPTDDVLQVKSVTLCRAHRLAMIRTYSQAMRQVAARIRKKPGPVPIVMVKGGK